MTNEIIFDMTFKANMKGGDVESFKRDYQTLYKTIITSMEIARMHEASLVHLEDNECDTMS